jgi:hypothetical protein
VARLLPCPATLWLVAKAITWPRLRWSLVRLGPVGAVTGVVLALLGYM